MLKIDAILAIAQSLRDLVIDANPVSLTGSTLQFNELVQPLSQQLQGFYGYIYQGAAVGQERIAGSFNPAANELVFPQVWASVPSINSSFMITEEWRKSDYENAIDRYMGRARTKFLEAVTATMAIVATQYEYTVPSGFEWISTLRFIPSSNTDYGDISDIRNIFELPPRYWRIEVNQGGSYIIAIDPRKIDLDEFDKQLVDIKGQRKPSVLGTDNAIIPPDLEEYIISGASMLLASQRIDEKQEWRAKFYMFRDEVKPLEDYVYRYGRGKPVRL